MAVAQFTPRRSPQLDAFARQVQQSLDLMPLAYAIFQHDQGEKRIDRTAEFYPVNGVEVITPEQRAALLDRAAVAHTLGDPARRALMSDMAAMAILRGVERGVLLGTIPADSPLTTLTLETAKTLASLAVDGALLFAACYPMGPATQHQTKASDHQ